jgi:Domain of unknown function (DUF4397)
MTVMNRRGLILMAGAALSLLSGCGGATQKAARFRVIHTSPDSGALAVRYNAEVAILSLGYKTASVYIDALSGGQIFHVVSAATPLAAPRFSKTLGLVPGDNTVVVLGGSGSLDLLALQDTTAPSPTSENALLRLIHAAHGLTNVDIYVTDPDTSLTSVAPTLSNVPFKSVSDYLELPGGNRRVRFTTAGSKVVRSDTNTISLTRGRVYTCLAVGGGEGPQETVTLLDQ